MNNIIRFKIKTSIFLIFNILACLSFISCPILSTGLGKAQDLVAPELSVTGYSIGDKDPDKVSFDSTIFCGKSISFRGSAYDNVDITAVRVEIKWNSTDYQFYRNAEFDGSNWSIDIDFEQEGACWLKFIAEDEKGNIGNKSTKVISLFVDYKAPEGRQWYVNRLVNGIQQPLMGLSSLKSIVEGDPELSEPSNVDVAQNGKFEITATFSDSTGIKNGPDDDEDDSDDLYITISIYNEDGNKISDLIRTKSDNPYAPVFEINGNETWLPETGIHYYQVRYSAKDLVTAPDTNSVENKEVDLGWFIWWPESDNPKCAFSNSLEDGKLILHVGDSLSVKVFDDDELKIGSKVKCELEKADSTKVEKTYDITKAGEREASIVVTAPDEPQDCKLVITAVDCNEKKINKTVDVSVVDDSKPSLILIAPENNQIPNVKVKKEGTTIKDVTINFNGIALDKSGCSYLEFVWVPDSITDKNGLAKRFLDNQNSNHAINAPTGTNLYKLCNGSGDFDKLKLWSIKLTNDGSEGIFKKQVFDFDLSLLKDFGDDKTKDKYFLIRLIRQDGTYTETELKLSADNIKPQIIAVVPSGNMAIVDNTKPIALKFRGVKETGIPMDVSKYEIIYKGKMHYDKNEDGKVDDDEYIEDASVKEGYNAAEDICYSRIMSVEEMATLTARRENPVFELTAEDILGNKTVEKYQFVLSSLPEIKSVTSSAPVKCKKGDVIQFNVSFSKAVSCPEDATLKLKNIVNASKNITKDTIVPAKYKSGNGSTTIVFEYVVQEGDTSTGIEVYDEASKGPIIGMDSTTAHLTTLGSNNLQNKRENNPITIDGISPNVVLIKISTDADPDKNKKSDVTYLRSGRTISAVVTTDKKVTVQGTPYIEFSGDNTKLILDWESITDTPDKKGSILTFTKKVLDNTVNGAFSYSNSAGISDIEKLLDGYGNVLVKPASVSVTTEKIYIDTVKPANAPKITSVVESENDSNNIMKSGNYKNSVTFTVSGASNSITQYSTDGGTEWKDYTGRITLDSVGSYSLIARITDYAGNVSPYSSPINININDTFPGYSVECTNADGNYKYNSNLKFKVYFDSPVKANSTSKAAIKLSGKNDTDKISSDAKATITEKSLAIQDYVTELEFEYNVKNTDDFVLKIGKDDVILDGVVDEYNISGTEKKMEADYVRENLHCDGIVPFVKTMTPKDKVKTATVDGKTVNVYSNPQEITLVFNEKVSVVSGKIYLRQTEGWAIPAVFTASEFNTILTALKDVTIDKTKTNNLTATQVLYLDEMEDSEWLFGSNPGVANDTYHGTGQYAGPYKKSSMGIKEDGSPDISTKYVLDFDVDIWSSENSSKTKFGTTYASGNSSQNNKQSNSSKDVAPKEGQYTITTENIRYVLEQVHLHERYMDVTSSSVSVGVDGKTVTLKFPAGLLGDSELPEGREWELVIEKGAFMDASGNLFGAESNGEINTDTESLVLIKDGNNDFFMSSGVAAPVIRVDRYSYGLGIYQPTLDSNNKIVMNYIKGDNSSRPTAYVRVKIDSQTKGATVRYSTKATSSTVSNNSGTVGFEDKDLTDKWIENCKSYCSSTSIEKPSSATDSTSNRKGSGVGSVVFLGGTGNYTYSSKEYIKADATFNGSNSSVVEEGIFQSVIHEVTPYNSNNKYLSQCGNGWTDVSIRGTTGFAGEPYISPFPLRDSQNGSPFLRRAFKYDNDYYWISYEVLVETSFSNYAKHSSNDKYDWARSWGILRPGEFTRCINMRQW